MVFYYGSPFFQYTIFNYMLFVFKYYVRLIYTILNVEFVNGQEHLIDVMLYLFIYILKKTTLRHSYQYSCYSESSVFVVNTFYQRFHLW